MTQTPESNISNGPHPAGNISIRVSAYAYIAAIFVGTFFSALAIYLETNLIGYFLLGASWILMPFLALTDKVVFNGNGPALGVLLPERGGMAPLEGCNTAPTARSLASTSRTNILISCDIASIGAVVSACLRKLKAS